MTRTLLAEPHHDGSELYVPDRPAEIGAEVTVRLRVPRATRVAEVAVRYVRDGEPRGVAAEIEEKTDTDTWWRATLPVWNPTVSYRWLLAGGDIGYAWHNGAGLHQRDVPDTDDFMLSLAAPGPDWHRHGVVYEIFPDRFEKSLGVSPLPFRETPRDSFPQASSSLPDWAIPREWAGLPTGRGPATPFELYGGDLEGIERHLDHIERLGADIVYLTPFFPASSSHRYDATSFDHIDPLLGGDAALVSLTRAAHARGIKVVGDLTLNHCGRDHDWFRAARADPGAPERELFTFDDALPNGYESWVGIPTLPKLNWSSAELRRRMGAVVRRWLEPPYDLDGWRIDVANMVGRYRDLALTTDVAREVRSQLGDKLLVAEHGHDFRADLQGDGWHGAMNYAGFMRPVWTWLLGDDVPEELRRSFWGIPIGVPRLSGSSTVATMRGFRAGLPWDRVLDSWTLLDSHDTARFATVAGSRERHVVGVGLQMTTPGVPMVFAGDEIGLAGEWGEDARRTMPWADPDTWDTALFDAYRDLISLRRSHEALAVGGMRYAHVGDDAFAYLRETPHERILCLAARASHEPVRLASAALGCERFETLLGDDVALDGGDVVLPAAGPAFHAWRLDS